MDWRIERLEVVASTNDVARDRVLAGWKRGEHAAGCVVVARQQTGGRGQHGRRWESPVGGLYLSAVVEDVAPELHGKLALIAGVAVAEALGNEVKELSLRWPNDLMVTGKKLGGILCEAVAMGGGDSAKWAGIIGIGINVATTAGEFPPAIRDRAISLAEIAAAAANWPVEKVLDSVLRQLGNQFDAVRCVDTWAGILERVRAMDGLRGKQIVVKTAGTQVTGTAAGIGDGGELLLLRTDDTDKITALEVATLLSVDGTPVRGS